MVVLHHVKDSFSGEFNPLKDSIYGAPGVTLFFVISGFIMFAACRRQTVWEFARNRFIRIVPFYWLALSCKFALLNVAVLWNAGGIRFVGDYFMSLAFIPHFNAFHPSEVWPILVPGWTLNLEIAFYVLFAIGLSIGSPVVFASVVIVASAASGLFFDMQGAIFKAYTNDVVVLFAAGMGIGYLHDRGLIKNVGFLFWISSAALLVVGSKFFHLPGSHYYLLIFSALLVIGLLSMEHIFTTPNGFMRVLGDASFSIYLTHVLIYGIILKASSKLPLDGVAQFLVSVPAAFSVSIAIGVLVHFRVEKPVIKTVKSMFRSGGRTAP